MIASTKLTNKLVSISAKLKGVSYINKGFEDVDIENEIEAVLTANFDDVLRLNINCDYEHYEDLRSLKKCAILNIEMLIIFKSIPDEENLDLIKKYLKNSFVNESNYKKK